MKRKIAVVTTARSDYGPSRWIIQDLFADGRFDARLVVGGSHLSPRHGMTVEEIEQDGFPIEARVPFVEESNDALAIGRGDGAALSAFVELLDRNRYDIVMVHGDRHELLPIATAALITGTPMAHVSGGDVSAGAIDDQVRHALTKLAHLHFASTATSGARVRQMGEERWRVHVVGDPAIDQMMRGPRAPLAELQELLGFEPDQTTLLVTLHPATLELDETPRMAAQLAAALREHRGRVVITAPAPDPGSDMIRAEWKKLIGQRPDIRFIESLGSRRYRSMLYRVGAVVGNSSSGLIECSFVPLPAVNIGRRQEGRETGANVIACPPQQAAIHEAITRALSPEFRASIKEAACPYGDGGASARILGVLAEMPARERLLHKQFQLAGEL